MHVLRTRKRESFETNYYRKRVQATPSIIRLKQGRKFKMHFQFYTFFALRSPSLKFSTLVEACSKDQNWDQQFFQWSWTISVSSLSEWCHSRHVTSSNDYSGFCMAMIMITMKMAQRKCLCTRCKHSLFTSLFSQIKQIFVNWTTPQRSCSTSNPFHLNDASMTLKFRQVKSQSKMIQQTIQSALFSSNFIIRERERWTYWAQMVNEMSEEKVLFHLSVNSNWMDGTQSAKMCYGYYDTWCRIWVVLQKDCKGDDETRWGGE